MPIHKSIAFKGLEMSTDHNAPIEQIIHQIDEVAENNERVKFGQVMDAVGRKSFASLLLIVGAIMVLPGPADIPGVPVLLGLLVVILCGQMLANSDHVWIPSWMERWEIGQSKVQKMLDWLRKPAAWIDSMTAQRWTWMMNHATISTLAVAAILVAMSTPVLEFIPFSANLAGGAIFAFALSILARDGLLAGVAVCIAVATFGLVGYQLLG
ncbi:exopolysaccharide biosynthesis protein [Rhodopirellula baltica]|uniref:exopolysaccharide biosynthesis protein n=1 Tax=Rhodopirellula baltica TaxID=265606 RepID=UPI0003089F74|nr:exopolysaccharide biosynthesis protein [Rhodopirellula baltica]